MIEPISFAHSFARSLARSFSRSLARSPQVPMIERGYATAEILSRSRQPGSRAKCFLSFPTAGLRPCPGSLVVSRSHSRFLPDRPSVDRPLCLPTNLVRLFLFALSRATFRGELTLYVTEVDISDSSSRSREHATDNHSIVGPR